MSKLDSTQNCDWLKCFELFFGSYLPRWFKIIQLELYKFGKEKSVSQGRICEFHTKMADFLILIFVSRIPWELLCIQTFSSSFSSS